jgi:ERCC4-related helicase
MLDLNRFVSTDAYDEDDIILLQNLRKLTDAEINKYIDKNSPFSGVWQNIIHTTNNGITAENKRFVNEYLHGKLVKLFEDNLNSHTVFYLTAGKTLNSQNIVPVKLSGNTITPFFVVSKQENGYLISGHTNIFNDEYSLEENEWMSSLLFFKNNTLYNWQNTEEAELVENYSTPKLIPADSWNDFAAEHIPMLTKTYQVRFEGGITKRLETGKPEIKLFLQERGDYLVFQPQFTYNGFDAPANEQVEFTIVKNSQIYIIDRQLTEERKFLQTLQGLHTNFIVQQKGWQFALRGNDVLKNNWFFLFIEAMKEMQILVYGFEALKNFKFNTAKPKTQVRISSGVDWFDANVDVTFGDMHVRIEDIKQALTNKQTYVPLTDGTLGILPEEWIKKYSLLFKVGQGNNQDLRLSKFHFSVIDELYDQRDEEELQIKLEEKFDNLRSFKKIKKIAPPANLQPILRPYQATGFHWLNFLQTTGCGGILADDMGLGKTIQALTMLLYYKEKHNQHVKAVVICPTTLLYNWENEIKKFTPALTYIIHHGSTRTRKHEDFADYNVIITTYGTLRSDITLLQNINFDYAILDESQAIKNPGSKVAKAACLLNCTHKLCMSGTPLQNNTFDIYAQLNFLNPGLLGTHDFFKNEFATPIDKFGEQEQKDHLRKLLFPFILRRTKEQVAKDLPEKTETILYCEMEAQQQQIYDAFRNDFRDKILGTIETQGIERSQLTILQGLMKLRQICDSPAILKEEDKYPNHSIKLDELGRELTENISDHKVLIFSQFLGMLALIKGKMKELGIQYEYFDGSTTVQDRQRAIENFQNNSECRVFLISLKAGGVGLNLTAADYVYIVDPWWNPAVEQQAIDRTHRIGQTRNIFAYRMICKNTIEDKIVQLQDKKRSLAKDLISDDSGFVKQLTREDVEYLFS